MRQVVSKEKKKREGKGKDDKKAKGDQIKTGRGRFIAHILTLVELSLRTSLLSPGSAGRRALRWASLPSSH